MEFVRSVVDFGNAPEIHVDGIASVDRISPNTVRVSMYSKHRGPSGEVENRIVAHLVWDRDLWMTLPDSHKMAANEMAREFGPPLSRSKN